jgi:hypothetical protein
MTPAERQSHAQRTEASRRLTENMRKCHAQRCYTERNTALAQEGLRQMASCAAPTEYAAVQQRWQSAQMASAGLQVQALNQLSDRSCAVLMAPEEERQLCLAQVSAVAGVQDASAVVADADNAGVESSHTGAALESLLRQLRTEPGAAEECAAKFMLYETFFSQVEKTRGDLFSFHAESRQTVPPAVALEMDKQLKAIDSTQAMGIPDDARTWFVYHMMRQASHNNGTMASIFRDFERKLEFLANQTETECPVCFETFGQSGPHVAQTLGCCHKVCQQCWQHWTQVTHGHPFCPLCRNEEFVNVVGHASQQGF